MKKVTVADSAGFCFGVKRAVDTVNEQLEKQKRPIYTFGPIIHNEQVIADFEKKGVRIIESSDRLEGLPCGTVIIRSHGVDRNTYHMLEEAGFDVVDATCPFVLKIHQYVRDYCEKGYHVVVIGNPAHPEVEGICGWGSPEQITVLSSREEAEKLKVSKDEKLCILSQTTFNYKKFQDLVEIIQKKRV